MYVQGFSYTILHLHIFLRLYIFSKPDNPRLTAPDGDGGGGGASGIGTAPAGPGSTAPLATGAGAPDDPRST